MNKSRLRLKKIEKEIRQDIRQRIIELLSPEDMRELIARNFTPKLKENFRKAGGFALAWRLVESMSPEERDWKLGADGFERMRRQIESMTPEESDRFFGITEGCEP
jgi:hypothetical protein